MDLPALDSGTAKLALAAETLRSSGRLRIRVTGVSMLPAVWPGDIVHVRRQELSAILPGQIVLFAREDRFFVHRAVEKIHRDGNPSLITRGDSVPQNDSPVYPHQLLGRVVSIERGRRQFDPPTRRSLAARTIGRLASRSPRFAGLLLRLHLRLIYSR